MVRRDNADDDNADDDGDNADDDADDCSSAVHVSPPVPANRQSWRFKWHDASSGVKSQVVSDI